MPPRMVFYSDIAIYSKFFYTSGITGRFVGQTMIHHHQLQIDHQ